MTSMSCHLYQYKSGKLVFISPFYVIYLFSLVVFVFKNSLGFFFFFCCQYVLTAAEKVTKHLHQGEINYLFAAILAARNGGSRDGVSCNWPSLILLLWTLGISKEHSKTVKTDYVGVCFSCTFLHSAHPRERAKMLGCSIFRSHIIWAKHICYLLCYSSGCAW